MCEVPPPTLYFDLIVDTFFLLEVVQNFFTGIYIAGEYQDSLPEVHPILNVNHDAPAAVLSTKTVSDQKSLPRTLLPLYCCSALRLCSAALPCLCGAALLSPGATSMIVLPGHIARALACLHTCHLAPISISALCRTRFGVWGLRQGVVFISAYVGTSLYIDTCLDSLQFQCARAWLCCARAACGEAGCGRQHCITCMTSGVPPNDMGMRAGVSALLLAVAGDRPSDFGAGVICGALCAQQQLRLGRSVGLAAARACHTRAQDGAHDEGPRVPHAACTMLMDTSYLTHHSKTRLLTCPARR